MPSCAPKPRASSMTYSGIILSCGIPSSSHSISAVCVEDLPVQYQMRGLAMPSSFSFFAASDACLRPRSVSELDTAILKAGFVASTPAASASSSAARTQVYELRRGATGGRSSSPVLPVENSSSTTDGVNSRGSAKAGAAIDVVPPTRSSRRVGTRRAVAVAATRRARRAVIAVVLQRILGPLSVLLIQSLAAVQGPSFLQRSWRALN
mmetsp:Transcript_19998/g.51988  ORF Transcript_19998/g.51988 Transcript_19998/m.51988 type:complete len:208 (-) Transcript_19998:57-680(-)